MKRIFTLMLVAILSISLTACGSKTYNDGKFVAFEMAYGNSGADVYWVEVTIEKGEIVDIYVDAKQPLSYDTEVDEEGNVKVTKVHYNKSKVELGPDYPMQKIMGSEYNWDEQVKLLTDFIVENGMDAVTLTDDDGHTDAVSGVTIKIGTIFHLIEDALECAKVVE